MREKNLHESASTGFGGQFDSSLDADLIAFLRSHCDERGLVPVLAVRTTSGDGIPPANVRGGTCVLNIGLDAIGYFKRAGDVFHIAVKFNGHARELVIGVQNIDSLYALDPSGLVVFNIVRSDPGKPDPVTRKKKASARVLPKRGTANVFSLTAARRAQQQGAEA